MTAQTPPTPPAARERKLETVCFEASTTSRFTSSAEGIEGVTEEDDDEDIVEREEKGRQYARSE